MDNKFVNEIVVDSIHYCTVVKPNSSSEGLNFITSDDKSMQVGVWNYKKGKELEPHYHNNFERSADITSESVYVSKGKILVKVYTKEDIYKIIKKGQKKKIKAKVIYDGPVEAPVKKNQVLAKLIIIYDQEPIGEYDLLAFTEVKKVNIFTRLIRSFNYLIWGDV